MAAEVDLTLYRWAGSWGPLRVKVPCGECNLTRDVIQDTLDHELAGIPVRYAAVDWLDVWWRALLRGGWHPPIVVVDGRVVSQGSALNRGVLTQAVIEAHARRSPVRGNHLFGKRTCPHCARAKVYLEEAGIRFTSNDVVKEPRALYEMLARVKPLVGRRTPITVPQIWLDGRYVGGADQLGALLGRMVEPNPERGRCSLSPPRGAGIVGPRPRLADAAPAPAALLAAPAKASRGGADG